MNGLPPASHSQPAHKMYTAGSLELHRGVEIQLCNTHKHRNIYQLCAEYFLDITHNGLGTFIAYLPTTRNYNATFTLSSGTLGRFSHGLRLTTLVLYGTLTCRPNKHWVDSRNCILRASGWDLYRSNPVKRRAAAELLFHRDLYCLIPVVCRVSGFP